MEIAQPLAMIPDNEQMNDVANDTINNHPHLFKVDTLINVNAFHRLLVRHPNPSFVNSVVDGL